MTEKMPADPMSAMAIASAGLHELFRSYVAAGFTEAQAMQLIAAMVASWPSP